MRRYSTEDIRHAFGCTRFRPASVTGSGHNDADGAAPLLLHDMLDSRRLLSSFPGSWEHNLDRSNYTIRDTAWWRIAASPAAPQDSFHDDECLVVDPLYEGGLNKMVTTTKENSKRRFQWTLRNRLQDDHKYCFAELFVKPAQANTRFSIIAPSTMIL